MSQGKIDRYSSWEMDELVAEIDPPFSFLADTFFSNVRQFDAEFIEHDIVEGGRRVAPFVSPLVNGVPTRRQGYRTAQIKPAYIKLADTVRPWDGFTRRAGERYGGELSPQERVDRIVAEQILTHLEMIANRREVMARDALFDGKITITSEDYPTTVVDFERVATNAATVGTLWSNGGATPLTDIQNHALLINRNSRGAVVDTLIMSGAVYDKLVSFDSVRDLLSLDKNLSPGTRGFDLGPRSGSRDAQYRGQLSNVYDVWTYDGYFDNDSAAATNLLPQDKVLMMAGEGAQGRTYYGAILDLEAGIRPQPVFVKSKEQWDPSGIDVLTQSAPMLALRRPNATGVLTVL